MKVISTEASELAAALMVANTHEWSREHPDLPRWNMATTCRSLMQPQFVNRQRCFQVVDQKEQVVGQVVARLSATLTCDQQSPLGLLGFFAALNNREYAVAMLQAACDWLHQQGVRRIIGPMDGSTWERYRLNLGPFENPAFLMEPENPIWYPELWEAAGFEVTDTYHSKRVTDLEAALTATSPSFEKARQAGYRIRPVNFAEFESELRTIYRLSCLSFCDNYLFEPIEESQFLDLYRPAQAIADPRLVLMAEDAKGEAVGFLFNVVDYALAVKAMNGGSGLWAKLRFLLNRKHARAVNFKSIGVVPDHRRHGVAGALMYQGYTATRELGFKIANLCLIRDGNASSRLDGGTGEILRRYALYQKV